MKTLIFHLKEHSGVLCKGLIGMSSSAGGTWISLLPQIETGMRILCLAAGFAVSLMTIWSIWKHRNDKQK